MKKPLVSIITVNFNSEHELNECLKSLAKSSGRSSKALFEVIVVNNDTPKTVNSLTSKMRSNFFPFSLRIIQADSNLGYGTANNVGAAQAKGKYLFFLNPDTLVQKKTLPKLITFLDRHPKAGVIAPTLLHPNGTRQQLQGSMELTPWVAITTYSLFRKLWPHNPWAVKYELQDRSTSKNKQVAAVPGSVLMIRTTVFKQVAGFDEVMFLYFEEHDLCQRVREKGWQVWNVASPKVIHHGGMSSKHKNGDSEDSQQLDARELKKHFTNSRFHYFHKHFGWWQAIIVETILRISKWHLLLMVLITIYILGIYSV